MNPGLKNRALPYSKGRPSRSKTRPPAARSTASPAAVSHSIVGAGRGYTSASPLAISTNLSEEPMDTRFPTRAAASHASVSGVLCDFEATAHSGVAGCRTPIDRVALEDPCGGQVARLACFDATSPQYISERAGAYTTPSVGAPFSMRPILTVKSVPR